MQILKRAGSLVVLLMIAAGTGAAEPRTPGSAWVPSLELIGDIESSIELPAEARPLATYARYYAGVTDEDGRRLVRAVYVAGGGKVVIVGDETKLPSILDGGCDVIDLKYDVTNHRLVFATCHGYA